MPPKGARVCDGFAENALRVGADTLELEYKDGHEAVVAVERTRPAVLNGMMLRPGRPPALRRTR